MGIPVKGVLVSVYVIAGLCAGVGAVVLAGRTGAGSPLYGNLLELDRIAAVIIGGASFLGGRGSPRPRAGRRRDDRGDPQRAEPAQRRVFYQMIAIGVIVVLAVEADVLRNHLERGRGRSRREANDEARRPVLTVRLRTSASAPCMP